MQTALQDQLRAQQEQEPQESVIGTGHVLICIPIRFAAHGLQMAFGNRGCGPAQELTG